MIENRKLNKINADIKKTEEKIVFYKNKLKELKRKKEELEQLEIYKLIKAQDMDYKDIAAIISKQKEEKKD